MANFCNHHVMQKFAHRSLRSLLTMFTALIPSFSLADVAAKKFALTTPVAEGFQLVKNEDAYQTERGFGFDAGADKVRFFSVKVPEGNHRVTITLGSETVATNTTIKAEMRRLMLENISTEVGEVVSHSFIVNTRTPLIEGSSKVSLKQPREAIDEAWAWDDRLTLEINGSNPMVRSIVIEPANVPTLYLCGDSTSCDQAKEPFNSWGQMITRFFQPSIAVANHGESGETVASSLRARRFEKVYHLLKPSDFVMIQFGHNDMKNGNSETYRAHLTQIATEVKKRGAELILITSMERMSGITKNTLLDFPEQVRHIAAQQRVTLIDLQVLSQTLYQTIGAKDLAKLFAFADGKQDGTHHNNYGSYQLAQCVLHSLQKQKHPLAKHIIEHFAYDPTQPTPVEHFEVPLSPAPQKIQRPDGDEDHP
jgi:lysophospholipase L1-like esterase